MALTEFTFRIAVLLLIAGNWEAGLTSSLLAAGPAVCTKTRLFD